MKHLLILISFCIASSMYGQVQINPKDKAGQGGGTMTGGSQASAGALAHVHCCPKIFVSTPSVKKGGKPSVRLVSSNLFKGKNAGIDLSFDVLDPAGAVVENGQSSISQNATGDIVVDSSKLAKGKKYRLRVKAGNDSELINL